MYALNLANVYKNFLLKGKSLKGKKENSCCAVIVLSFTEDYLVQLNITPVFFWFFLVGEESS